MDFVIKRHGKKVEVIHFENKLNRPSAPVKENQAWMRKVNKK